MYYPKSQVKTNLYTNGGKYSLQGSTESYVGYYYETSDGRVFTGRTPADVPSTELIFYPNPSDTSFLNGDEYSSFYVVEDRGYLQSTSLQLRGSAPSAPKQSYPIVTENDYKLGEFQRYFLKKGNETKFLEISLEDYRKYVNQDSDVMFELYVPIQINWILTGDKDQVYKVNQSIVSRAEREQNLPGFTQYFRDRFTQFYK
jgi:hypothetical protein